MTTTSTAEATQAQTSPAIAAQAQAANQNSGKKDANDNGGMSFGDILEVINPLQHIPIISTVYRELTGDTITPAARVAGDALYGGIIGLASSLVNEVVDGTTGKDIGGHIWATLFGDDDDAKPAETAATPANATVTTAATPVAAASPPAATPSSAPVTPLNGPTSFYQTLQRPHTGSHGVPLSATVPTGDSSRITNNEALQKAQATQAGGNGQPGQANPAAASVMGTTGISAGTAPPPAIAPAPPSFNATPPAAVAPPNVTDLMMSALDKYKAMAQQQNGTVSPAPTVAAGAPTS